MALMNPVLRRKIQPLPTGTVAAPMSFSGSPASIKGTAPRTPGMVSPTPVAPQTTPTRVIGFDGPREPPKAPTPMVDPRKPPPAAAETAVPGTQNAGAPAATDAEAKRAALDQMINDFLSGTIGRAGKADTAEEEALIRQQMADAAGGMSVNARARAGRSGMASSGALMGQEGDIRRSTSQDALDQILGLRRTEEQRGIENAMGAIGAETGMRSAAANDQLRKLALDMALKEAGLDDTPTTAGQDMQNLRPEDYASAPRDPNYGAGMSPAEQANLAVVKFEGDDVWVMDRNVDPPKLVRMSKADLSNITGQRLV